MTANIDGPADPRDYYSYSAATGDTGAASLSQIHTEHIGGGGENRSVAAAAAAANRAYTSSPNRAEPRSFSDPTRSSTPTLNFARSNPVLFPSRQPGSVKDIANRFDQNTAAAGALTATATAGAKPPQLSVRTSQERVKRFPGNKNRSPVSTGRGKSESGMAKLQKRRPGQPKSPQKSPVTSVDTSSYGSKSTASSVRSQARAALSPKKPRSPSRQAGYVTTKPLFGELTADGWHGNFDLASYTPLPSFQPTPRRQSDGGVALSHGRSQSYQNMARPALSPPTTRELQHKRSRSDMDALRPQPAPSMPHLNTQGIPVLYPTPPSSGVRNNLPRDSPTSRIPVSNRRKSGDYASDPYSRSASAMSNPSRGGRRKLSKSPTRIKPTPGKENATPSSIPRSRYQPPPLSTAQANHMLAAKIVTQMPKTSPPLRSSRPRQPVSSATTSASRARAAERFQSPEAAKDGRRPSEQWLGKPYDAQKERTRRRIPELGKVDFAERRARIQMAISQNLEESNSQEALRSRSQSRSQSRKPSEDRPTQPAVRGLEGRPNSVDEHQAAEMNRETDAIETMQGWRERVRPGGLNLDTTHLTEAQEVEPMTAATEFEVDESPVLGRQSMENEQPYYDCEPEMPTEDSPVLLSSAEYRPAPARSHMPPPIEPALKASEEEVQGVSEFLDDARTQQRRESPGSHDGTEFAEDSPAAEDSPSDIEDRWGLATSGEGSIKIMLDEEPTATHQPEPLANHVEQDSSHVQHEIAEEAAFTQDHNGEASIAKSYTESPVESYVQNRLAHETADVQEYDPREYGSNGYTESPVEGDVDFPDGMQDTPRKHEQHRDDTLKPTIFEPQALALQAEPRLLGSDDAIASALDEYQNTGSITPEILEYIQRHDVDLQRSSANQGSDAIMVQNLLESMLKARQGYDGETPEPVDEIKPQEVETLEPKQYDMPSVTPETPSDAAMETGTAVIWANDYGYDTHTDEDDDFQAKIRQADEEWEMQQTDGAVLGADEDDDRPTPPPKDIRPEFPSNVGSVIKGLAPPNVNAGLRISTSQIDILPEVYAAGESAKNIPSNTRSSSTSDVPPPPDHAPPPPPSPSAVRLPLGVPEVPQIPASYSERGSTEASPVVRKPVWGGSVSSRPSVDGQATPGPSLLAGAASMSSFADSTRQSSIGTDSQARHAKVMSPGPEQKRLMKRKHIIRELLDTENTYHQDLKIIEDIYKATVADMVSAEDKKTLFGNCDEIEQFSLHFFDDLRKSVESIYKPPKQMRWANKRGSFSTVQSEATGKTSMSNNDSSPDEEKDRGTTIGQCFLANFPQMDVVYGAYLRNHDAANQRLSALKTNPSVKCWLDECHNNASDITSAWDLDSLLVKPTQRVSKYPMLLQQLLDTTPAGHPDHAALKAACKESIGMLTRINEAKKRADIVDQIINRKGKETDVRSGIAKAFGRRTEKLKERVGIAEAFQDAQFDELSHKFGGHFIRLQICMRDFQDYMHRIDKGIEQISNCAGALDMFADVSTSSLPEVQSKWRRYGQVIREITSVAFPEHKAAVQRRVIQPMITCIKLHEGPQNAISKRKKRIVDYAKCRSIEKRGEKPDRKTVEASEMYVALNDQLKIELPKLYALTAQLVQSCLKCFLDVQLSWQNMWDRKLRPILEAADIPSSIQQIEPAFRPDYDIVKGKLTELGVCNGAFLADSANFLSPTTTLVDRSEESSLKRPSTFESSKRTPSFGSDSPIPGLTKRYSNGYASSSEVPPVPSDARMRSNSSLSTRGTANLQAPSTRLSSGRTWASNNGTPTSSFSTSRPATANASPGLQATFELPRQSTDTTYSGRPSSGQTYTTARADSPPDLNEYRFSQGIFSSALPPDALASSSAESTRRVTPSAPQPPPPSTASKDAPSIFVCVSLFEFSIDKTRKEAGFPYLTYVQGEVFDVVAQKGELWLARNQDDADGVLGWIWEQHFVILSGD